jgi:uncharacterized protein
MTIASALGGELRRDGPSHEQKRIFQTSADTSVLGYCAWQAHRQDAPTVVFLHGLTGDADDCFVRGTAQKAYQLGFNTIRLNSRNCGGTSDLTPTIYHMGLTMDLKAVLAELADRDALKRLYFGGFSMGANISLKLAGEWGVNPPEYIAGLFAISPPLELARSSRAISRGFINRCYEIKFVRILKDLIREKSKHFPKRYDTKGLASIRTLRHFDSEYVAPCFGFQDADDYYENASAGPVVDEIVLPTLVVHAEDDPLIPKMSVRSWQTRAKDNIYFVITKEGGHVGFIGSKPSAEFGHLDPDRYWAENRIVQYLDAVEQSYSSSGKK